MFRAWLTRPGVALSGKDGGYDRSATKCSTVCAAGLIIELAVGERFLDAVCNGGYFPLLLAGRIPFVRKVVGVDRDANVFKVAQDLAEERQVLTTFATALGLAAVLTIPLTHMPVLFLGMTLTQK